MKKWFLIIGIITIVLVVLGIWGPKLYLKILEEQIDNISIAQTKVGKHSIDMNIWVDISSKEIPILIDSMAYRTEIYDTIISEGVKVFNNTNRNASTLYFPVTVHNDLLKKNIKLHQGAKTDVKMYIRHYCHFPVLGKRTVDVIKHVHMMIPIIPEAKISDVQVEKFGLDNMVMNVTLAVYNPNNIDFVIKEMSYHTQVKDYATSHDKVEKDYHIKRFDTTFITILVHTDLHHEVKALIKTIKGDTEWPYTMKTEMVLDPSESRISDIHMSSEKNGKVDVKSAMKAMKNKEHVGVDENK
jgi:LEA14-like dessication related protein